MRLDPRARPDSAQAGHLCSALERAARTDAARGRPWVVGATGGVFLLIAALICADYLGDAQADDARVHAAIELMLMTIAVAAGMIFWSRFVALRRREPQA